MSIVFRNVKGSALTYTEMDRNQAQFFYSASVAASTLKLHYTGSSVLNSEGQTDYEPRFVEVPLGSGGGNQIIEAGTGISITNGSVPNSIIITNTGTATPGSPNTSIQFNDGGSFAGDNSFVYDKTNDFVGIGITSGMQRRLHINDNLTGGAIIRLQANDGNGPRKEAFLEIGNRFNSTLTQIGKVNPNSLHTYIHQTENTQRTHFSFVNTSSITATVSNVGIGIGTQSPTRDLSILSNSKKGIGISGGDARGVENRIRILPDAVWQKTFVDNSGIPLDGINRYGLGMQTPIQGSSEGGNMLIAVSDTREGINESRDPNRLLITAYDVDNNDDSLEGTPVHIASFTAAGRVGINTPDPNQDIRLDINGQYRGAYKEQEADYDLDFKNYSVIKITDSIGGSPTLGITGNIPPAGTKAVLILHATIKAVDMQLLATANLISGANLETEPNKYSTITFVSDGTNLIETSRTVNMA
jgi:hypothetical protein